MRSTVHLPFGWWAHLVNDFGCDADSRHMGSVLRYGRLYLNMGQREVGWSWNVFTKDRFLHAYITTDDLNDSDVTVSLGLWLGTAWFHVSGFRGGYRAPREWGVHVRHGSIHWVLGADSHSWSSTDPRWRQGSWNATNALLGKPVYSTRVLETQRAPVPMPEGAYEATVVLSESRWKRPRWPWPKVLRCAEVKPDVPIGHPGKGENAYDCGPDATWSLSCPASTVHAAVSAMVASVLRDRERYGGKLTYDEAVDG